MNKKINTAILSVGIGALLIASTVAPAFAQTGVGLGVSASASATTPIGTATVSANVIAKVQARANQEITRRLTSLNNLSTRVGQMKNLSASEQAALTTNIQAQITAMNTLQTQIAADISAKNITQLRADVKSITVSYRIFMLIIPQGYIEAASDRVMTIVGIMNDLGTKFQARITAAQTAGANVTAVTATFADFNAKVSDANTQAQAAATEVASLTPDNGVQAQMQANTAALKDARAKIKVAQQDLTAARQDAVTIIADLKAFESTSAAASGSVSATTTASTTTTAQ